MYIMSRPHHNPGRTAVVAEHLSVSPADHLHVSGLSHVYIHKHRTLAVVVWCSGSALVSINEVNLRRARLIMGWVTVSGFIAIPGAGHLLSAQCISSIGQIIKSVCVSVRQ